MSWAKAKGSRRRAQNNDATLLLGGWVSWICGLLLVVAAFVLARGLLYVESDRQASPERMTEDRLRGFIEEHSWLEYTTEGGETLASLANDLRLGDPDRIREDNPKLAERSDGDPLEAGLEIRVRYNQLEADDFLAEEED